MPRCGARDGAARDRRDLGARGRDRRPARQDRAAGELPRALRPTGSRRRSACSRERRDRARSASATPPCARRGSASPAATPTLTLAELDAALDRLLEVRGKGTGAERARLLHELFARATADEQDFLVRLLLGELRQGALEGLMVEAVAKASGAAGRRRAARGDDGRRHRHGRQGRARRRTERGWRAFAIQLFRPIKPMLAQPADDLADALGTLGRAAFEYKLDGARMQVHKAGDEVRVFSRRLNEVTAAVPEIVEAVQGPARARGDPGRRSDRAAPRRLAAAVPDHHAPVRTQARRRRDAAEPAAAVVLLRRPGARRRCRSSTGPPASASPRSATLCRQPCASRAR